MTKKCEYYILEPILTERTPLLMNDSSINPKGTTFLYLHSKVDDDYVAHLQFKMSVKNPDMDVDYLFLETFPVFSKKVYTELQKHMPINSLQLVKAVINEDGEEYNDFWISYPYREIRSFDEKKSTVRKINTEGVWFGLKKIVLDNDLLEQIPLEERLVFKAAEDVAFQLYHQSVVDIIKSVDPKGVQFIPTKEYVK